MHRIHVAILKQPYIAAILRGEKTVESRLTASPRPPLDAIAPGERLFLKASGGPFLATAIAGEVHFYRDLDAAGVRELGERYGASVGGDDDYWRRKADSRYATFVSLRDVEPMDVGPRYRKANMKAWYALPEASSPLVDVPLTAGAIRNRWVAVPRSYELFPEGAATLLMPDGRVLESSINARRHIGGRGWGRYHRAYGIGPGDCVRFAVMGDRRYRVSYVKRAFPA